MKGKAERANPLGVLGVGVGDHHHRSPPSSPLRQRQRSRRGSDLRLTVNTSQAYRFTLVKLGEAVLHLKRCGDLEEHLPCPQLLTLWRRDRVKGHSHEQSPLS